MLLLFVFAACADWPAVSVFKLKTQVKALSISEANDEAMTKLGKPLYVLEIKVDSDEDSASEEVDYFLASSDVSTDNIKVEFLVTQSVITQTGESISILVSAGPLSFTDTENNTYGTNKAILGYEEVNPENVSVSAEVADDNSLIVTVSYIGGKTVAADTELFVFTAEWEATEELKAHPGVYTSEVSMTYLME